MAAVARGARRGRARRSSRRRRARSVGAALLHALPRRGRRAIEEEALGALTALFQIAEPGESRAKQACRTRAVGIDLGHHELAGRGRRRDGKPPCLADDERRRAACPSVVHYGDGRRRGRRRARAQALARRAPARHHRLGEALHGPRRRTTPRRRASWRRTSSPAERRRRCVRFAVARRPRGDAGRGLGRDPARAASARRGRARRTVERRGDHRARLLRRRAAPGHQGRRPARRPRGAAPAQRADRGGARLRPRQAAEGHVRGLRPRRRHLRHLDPQARRRRVRGEGDRRRLARSAATTSTARSPSALLRDDRAPAERDAATSCAACWTRRARVKDALTDARGASRSRWRRRRRADASR